MNLRKVNGASKTTYFESRAGGSCIVESHRARTVKPRFECVAGSKKVGLKGAWCIEFDENYVFRILSRWIMHREIASCPHSQARSSSTSWGRRRWACPCTPSSGCARRASARAWRQTRSFFFLVNLNFQRIRFLSEKKLFSAGRCSKTRK